jgi:hypothetical protein
MPLLSRAVLAIILLLLGGMMTVLHRDVDKVEQHITRLEAKVDEIKLQKAIGYIGKPRALPVRHLYKRAPTVLDAICKPVS